MVVGLVASVVLASGSLLQAFGMIVLGLLMGMAGTDVNSGMERYTFDTPYMAEGINFVILAMGMFGLGEIIKNLEEEHLRSAMVSKVQGLLPNKDDLKRMAWPIVRGTGLGSLLGILPGGGAMLASFASYSIEKKISKTPEQFGKGAIEGVAGPESANNAGAQTSFIPLQQGTAGQHHRGDQTNHHQGEIFGCTKLQSDVCQRWRKQCQQYGCESTSHERADCRSGQSLARFALTSHLITVECGNHRRGFAWQIDQNGRGGTTILIYNRDLKCQKIYETFGPGCCT